ncbi:peptidase M23-like protein [Kineococcus xinjiangensis]|uniref:Peptidase M23-like protein n=1 Tax=Kineococcus xinjiangensis TaxID=512762 RepID=A0A2S6IEH7_9ACTN|nr:peptidase inhibitor family I36 protein [Kineococcus xinjiangensis]PPK92624.1 peptidase M23-like protein [Kineococcus xinjiangensis]
MKLARTARALIAATGLTATAVIGLAAPAQAAGRDGRCDTGEFCLYYNSNHAGSVSDFAGSIADYGATQPECYEFKGAGNGQGKCVKNNATSAWNRTSGPVTVYFNSGHSGAGQAIGSGGKVNLNDTLKNENASHKFGTSSTGNANMSHSLYNLSGGSITAGFDGYRNVSGRHEGIDIARGVGSPVRALIGGQVINIVRGSTGSGGLSTIAVYNAKFDKTVIYLHTEPIAGLSVGQSISRDQKIAVESWRGVSSSSAAHTHVEMRPGRRTHAAKSVDDYNLENPNPTSFWNARGYNVR